MSDLNRHIERYLRGELTPAEMHALEKKALHDPFLAEALEGAQLAGPEHFSTDLQRLHRAIRKKTKKRRRRGVVIWLGNLPMSIAAGLLLIAVSSYVVIRFIREQERKSPQDHLALKKEDHEQLVPEMKAEEKKDEKEIVQPATTQTEPDVTEAIEKTTEIKSLAKPTPRADERMRRIQPTAPDPGQGVIAEAVPMQETPSEEQLAPPVVKGPDEEAEKETADVSKAQPVEESTSEKTARAKVAKKAEPLKEEGVQTAPPAMQGFRKPARGAFTVQGKVISSDDGMGLPGVNVRVKGTTVGTVTDEQGNYSIAVNDTSQVLLYNFIGMMSQEVKANRAQIDVSMEPDYSALSEVVVTGYGGAPSGDTRDMSYSPAVPEGGKGSFRNYLEEKMQYPRQALEKKIEGVVVVEFTVGTSGNLSDYKIIRSLGYGCDEEALRLIQEGPSWTPARRGNEPLSDKVRVRVRFKLPD